MLFPTHLIFGLSIGILLDLNLVAVLIGSAIPDLIDKPLCEVGFTDNYHSVAHSGSVTFAIFIACYLIYTLFGFKISLVIGAGWIVHILLDMLNMLLNSRSEDIRFLLWPFDFQDEPLNIPPGQFYQYYKGTRSYYLEIAFWVLFILGFIHNFSYILTSTKLLGFT